MLGSRGSVCSVLLLSVCLLCFATKSAGIPMTAEFSSSITEEVKSDAGIEKYSMNITEKIVVGDDATGTNVSDCPTFADLAVEFMRASFWDFASAIPKILDDTNVSPEDVAPLRTGGRVLLTMLEVFAPLLPAPASSIGTEQGVWSPDVWDMMADDLDSGTDVLYSFEKLASSHDPPSPKEESVHRKRVMQWRAQWDKDVKKFDYEGYVEQISPNKTFSHWAQSEFFWRDRPAPLPDQPGMRAVLVLVHSQILAVSDLATEVLTVTEMHTTAAHALALRFYTACSSVLDESVAFGKGLFVPSSPTASALKGLEELTTDYFALEGLYHDYRHAQKAADPKKIKTALHKLNKAWATLAAKQEALNMPALLAVLILSLSSPC